ncbi:MAG: efflux RND transporter periplasmic adaptor subunit [Microscillaceae bacterium]|nr:efflux RND transporter periplasmic adaptor subunit [Microscillaceae bacterium]MDW8461480.1 efflux RND transporter periplasmic adaptor subunit [Cytophagales bacterium]
MTIHCKTAFLLFIATTACQKLTDSIDEKTKLVKDEKIITLTEAQQKAIGLEIGTWEKHYIGKSIKANGVIDVPPNAKAIVSSQVEGFVKYLDILNGEFVQKGQLLTQLEHFQFVKLQENYLITKSEYQFLEQDLERQRLLAQENVNAVKNLQKIQSEFEIIKAKKASLERQLQLLGIEPTQVSPQNLKTVINITSPIAGYVKAVHINLGKNVLPNTPLFEIINTDHKHLELQVFEKDVLQIKPKQKVTFQVPSLGNQEYEGEVYLIEKSFNPQSKTIGIHAHFDKEKEEKFMEGMFVNANIWTEAHEVNGLPEEAIVSEGDLYYVFVQVKPYTFQKIGVKLQNKEKGFVQIIPLEELPENPQFVKKGAYYLHAQLLQSEKE